MKRLVYSPRVEFYVDGDDGVYDLSPYVTSGAVSRKLDQISSADITIRNPDLMFTKKRLFHPMDRVVITMTRLRDKPIQVFTGYLDESPYLQLFPGTVTFKASCSLKKLLYTYFDPGLPYFNEWLKEHGWQETEGGGIVKRDQDPADLTKDGNLMDSSFGKLLFSVLTEIGGWDSEAIYIEKLPENLPTLVEDLLFARRRSEAKEANTDFTALLHDIIGTVALGAGDLASPVSTNPSIDAGNILYVGDSLGVGTKPILDKLVDNITFDCVSGRPSTQGLQVVQQKLTDKHKTLVFDLGTNDGAANATEQSMWKALKLAGKERNFVCATLNTPYAESSKNQAIRDLAARNDNVTVVDWNGVDGLSDGVHGNYEERADRFAEVLK